VGLAAHNEQPTITSGFITKRTLSSNLWLQLLVVQAAVKVICGLHG